MRGRSRAPRRRTGPGSIRAPVPAARPRCSRGWHARRARGCSRPRPRNTGPASSGPRRLHAEIRALLAAGPHRRAEDEVCPLARDGACGGCDWPAARLESHGALKEALVRDALRRIGRIADGELPAFRFVPSPRAYRLRSRLRWDGREALGFLGRASSRVADLRQCEVVTDSLLGRLPALRTALASAAHIAKDITKDIIKIKILIIISTLITLKRLMTKLIILFSFSIIR